MKMIGTIICINETDIKCKVDMYLGNTILDSDIMVLNKQVFCWNVKKNEQFTFKKGFRPVLIKEKKRLFA